MKIFIIAGEDSGDKLGSEIIDSLRAAIDGSPNFVGIGGSGMISRGLKTIFPMSELSVMGFVEIALQYRNLKVVHHYNQCHPFFLYFPPQGNKDDILLKELFRDASKAMYKS